MPKRADINKVLVIGSGPIVIGQAAEFDYAGTQACRALKEEGIEVVLINSNPATIMTDTEIADRVYIEPLTVEFATRIIEQEKPDGLLPTLGGQTGLNLATKLALSGILEKYNVQLLGTPLSAIKKAEDREEFKRLMSDINEPVPESITVESLDGVTEFAEQIGFPLIIRPAYTLGGTGGGIAYNMDELIEITTRGLQLSMRNQVLIEQCITGWKEIEYEVMRDSADNCITICNMENLDPVGVHTGDSIVVAPSQTLADKEYQLLRSASLKIIRALGIEGGCNVQLGLDPKSMDYFVIEVNPRVSRSSALASKATGYPIARVAAKIAIGLTLDEIPNAVTQKTLACFEPALDYCVVKIPRWPFDKFKLADRSVGTQMKATGEVMSIDRTFESALMKALRSLEIGVFGLRLKNINLWTEMQIEECLKNPTDERIFVIAEAFRRGMDVDELHTLSGVDDWFLEKIKKLVDMEGQLRNHDIVTDPKLPTHYELMKKAKYLGFADRAIADLTGRTEIEVRNARKSMGILPVYKMVDTCAAEFDAETPYFYSTYEDLGNKDADESPIICRDKKKKAIVLGSGPIRIGQGIEFDYCSVHSVWALRNAGYESVIINNNPETVSTDFDTSDKLYFEPLTFEDVMNVIEIEKPEGVIVQFGGQTAINLAGPLSRAGVKILGSSVESIDMAEDRDQFERLLRDLGIAKPAGRAVTSTDEAVAVAEGIGYPVLVRPSYVLGGRAMEIVYSTEDLKNYMNYAVDVSPKAPILVDKYVLGKEVEADVIGDGEVCLMPGIMEHIERAGVHSGDSMAVYPPQTLSKKVKDQIIDYALKLSKALKVYGLMNIQYVVDEDENVFIIEVNPRASRTIPYLSKITGIPMVRVATRVMLGEKLKDMGYTGGLVASKPLIAVKAPVFSFSKLIKVDIGLGPEMKSTGEILGMDNEFSPALYKAMVASGLDVASDGAMIATLANRDKEEALPIIKNFSDMGFRIYATEGTAQFLHSHNIPVERVFKISEDGSPDMLELIRTGKVDLLINTISNDKQIEREGAVIRRAAVEHNIPCLTSLDTANALWKALNSTKNNGDMTANTIDEYVKGV